MSQYPAVVQLSDLDGTDGFLIVGAHNYGFAGASVASAGDVNGDGFDDMLVGAPDDSPNDLYSGSTYVIFGKAGGFDATLDVADLDGTNGFRIDGIAAGNMSGQSVASAGDVNGDGYADMIIGSNGCGCEGSAYVVFGSAQGFDPTLQLADLDGTDGFRINAGPDSGGTGWSVSSAGDVNGDGYDDMIVGAPDSYTGGNYSGASYVVFGKATPFDAQLELGDLDGTDGFRIDGTTDDASGISVSSAGDVNGDGYDDMLIGAYGSNDATGGAYVVFGKGTPFTAVLDASAVDGTNGFHIQGRDAQTYTGYSVSAAGDVNGDGFADVIIGAFGAGDDQAGQSYVVFGKSGGFNPVLDLNNLNGINGFYLNGANLGDYSGYSVSSAGDVNGDGFDDLLVSSPHAAPGLDYYGASYVVFGKHGGFSTSVNLGTLDGTDGFRLQGAADFDVVGLAATTAGDVNGDGLSDLIVRVYGLGGDPVSSAYVMFGQLPDTSVDRLGTRASQSLVGGDLADTLRGAGGDDALWGHGGNDKLSGNAGDDTIKAGDGNDRLTGGDGADLLIGGAGKDVMRGGEDADTFAFSDGDSADGGRDRILDFAQGTDLIDLSAIDADTGTAGNQAFTFSTAHRLSGTAGELIARAHGSDTVILGDTDGDGHADFSLVLSGSFTLTTADFTL